MAAPGGGTNSIRISKKDPKLKKMEEDVRNEIVRKMLYFFWIRKAHCHARYGQSRRYRKQFTPGTVNHAINSWALS